MPVTMAALKNKWREVPYGAKRLYSADLLKLDDGKLLRAWQVSCIDAVPYRSWYYSELSDKLSGKKVLDVGCGIAYDGLRFARRGAFMTFSDIVEDNIKVVERLCGIFKVKADFLYIHDNSSFNTLPYDYDAIIAIGSLHHAPRDIIVPEVQEIAQHLKTGGMWWQLAYPKSRPFSWLPPWLWGRLTDGLRTPWAEWYDAGKLLGVLPPRQFELVDYREHNREFNAIELKKVG